MMNKTFLFYVTHLFKDFNLTPSIKKGISRLGMIP